MKIIKKGFTLVETILTLFLFSIFILILYSIFMGGFKTASTGIALGNGQQTVRIATEVLFRELRNAKHISTTQPSDYPFYAVYAAPRGEHPGLYIYTNWYTSAENPPETIAIAGYINSMEFYRVATDPEGIVRVRIKSDEEKDKSNAEIEIPLENMQEFGNIMEPSDILYYTKYE